MGRAPTSTHRLPHWAAMGKKNGAAILALIRVQKFISEAPSPYGGTY